MRVAQLSPSATTMLMVKVMVIVVVPTEAGQFAPTREVPPPLLVEAVVVSATGGEAEERSSTPKPIA